MLPFPLLLRNTTFPCIGKGTSENNHKKLLTRHPELVEGRGRCPPSVDGGGVLQISSLQHNTSCETAQY